MPDTAAIFLGKGRTPLEVLLSRANRHGLIARATGTGKTVHGVPGSILRR